MIHSALPSGLEVLRAGSGVGGSYTCVAYVHGVCSSVERFWRSGFVISMTLSSGGDRGSRMLFAGKRGGGRNATAGKSLK
jgi:hypothetical protein